MKFLILSFLLSLNSFARIPASTENIIVESVLTVKIYEIINERYTNNKVSYISFKGKIDGFEFEKNNNQNDSDYVYKIDFDEYAEGLSQCLNRFKEGSNYINIWGQYYILTYNSDNKLLNIEASSLNKYTNYKCSVEKIK